MIFGRQPQGYAATLYRSTGTPNSRRGLTRGISWLFATLLVLAPIALVSTGCGGSSSSGPGTGSSSQTRDAKITGIVLDQYVGTPIVGATITFGTLSTFTAGDGSFTLSVSSGTSGAVKVQGPAGVSYYSTGQVGGRSYDLKNTGISVPSLTPQQTYSIGTILLTNQSYPPPPPVGI